MNIMVYNTGETPEDLKKEYNPEGSILRDVQYRMLDMLLYIDRICKEIDVRYRIDGGTVLGAVRHKGFIPWDDDMDLCLERKDWKKLVKYLKEHPHPQFVLQDHDTDSNYYGSWAILRDLKSEYIIDDRVHNIKKYRGLQVDLFPFEKGNISFFQRICSAITIWNNRNIASKRMKLVKIIHFIQFKLLIPTFRLITRIINREGYYMHSYGAYWTIKFPQDICVPHQMIEFEGYMVPGPGNPEEYLRIVYKNYMDLPPKNKRDHHRASYKIWD